MWHIHEFMVGLLEKAVQNSPHCKRYYTTFFIAKFKQERMTQDSGEYESNFEWSLTAISDFELGWFTNL